jgi:CSLREA domain-containing protein
MNNKQLIFNLLITSAIAILLPMPIIAATLQVNKIQDTSDGSCDSFDCSLREAMATAQFGDTINFSPLFDSQQTIVLNGTNLVFSSDVTLQGPGQNLLTISGNQLSRVFLIPASLSVGIRHLSVTNGFAATGSGGGIAAAGNLELQNVSISQSRASQFGGGIIAQSGLNISNVLISANQSSRGGGVYIIGTAVGQIRKSIINNNVALGDGGGIDVEDGSLTLIESTVISNSARDFGGGIYNNSGLLILEESSIIGNSTIRSSSTASGVDSSSGRLEIRNCTFSGNIITESSFSTRNAGALWTSSQTTITGSTFTQNSAPAGNLNASGIFHSAGTLTIRNSIVAGNSHIGGIKDINSVLPASFISQGYNLIGNAEGAVFNVINDQAGTTAFPLDPALFPLANNGGLTQTHAPQENSPALDRGFSFGLTRDQRGSNRPEDNVNISNASDGADIGAYEVFQDLIFQNGFGGFRPE